VPKSVVKFWRRPLIKLVTIASSDNYHFGDYSQKEKGDHIGHPGQYGNYLSRFQKISFSLI
jgi:hypothetical protein